MAARASRGASADSAWRRRRIAHAHQRAHNSSVSWQKARRVYLARAAGKIKQGSGIMKTSAQHRAHAPRRAHMCALRLPFKILRNIVLAF